MLNSPASVGVSCPLATVATIAAKAFTVSSALPRGGSAKRTGRSFLGGANPFETKTNGHEVALLGQLNDLARDFLSFTVEQGFDR